MTPDKEVVRVVANPETLQEAQEMILSASGYMDRLQKQVRPPAGFVGLKLAAGAAVTFGGFVWLACKLSQLRWQDTQALKNAVHEVLDEREQIRQGRT